LKLKKEKKKKKTHTHTIKEGRPHGLSQLDIYPAPYQLDRFLQKKKKKSVFIS
jgi:hypothetical protein